VTGRGHPPTGHGTAGKGKRGADTNPPNRFERFHFEPLDIDIPPDSGDDRSVRTVYYRDTSRSVLARNDSPDIPFTFSLNPYRGCEHGCVYCYARPSHEYLGFSSGLDFESKILVKTDAPSLLARQLGRASWVPQMVALCGNTDCYQPVERTLGITGKCLEVFMRFRNPVGIITKNSLILRDIGLLSEMAAMRLVTVSVSITSLDRDLTGRMEPRTAAPAKRLETVGRLSAAGIPVSVFVAPVIPGLTDHEIPAILEEAARCGARSAAMTLLRLPGPVGGLFTRWLEREYPDGAKKVLSRVRGMRRGKLNDSEWGKRMSGNGAVADAISALFNVTAGRLGLDRGMPDFDLSSFRRGDPSQGSLFD